MRQQSVLRLAQPTSLWKRRIFFDATEAVLEIRILFWCDSDWLEKTLLAWWNYDCFETRSLLNSTAVSFKTYLSHMDSAPHLYTAISLTCSGGEHNWYDTFIYVWKHRIRTLFVKIVLISFLEESLDFQQSDIALRLFDKFWKSLYCDL